MDKGNRSLSDVKPAASKASRRVTRPQVLDLRPGHQQLRKISSPIKSTAKRANNKSARAKADQIDRQLDQQQVSPKVNTPSGDDNPTSKTLTKVAAQRKTDKTTRLQPHKIVQHTRKRIDKMTVSAVKHGKKFIIERWEHVRMARRNVVLWLGLILLLIIGSLAQTLYYGSQNTVQAAVDGGTYAEGTIDKLTTISPLYATTSTEKAASQLVYPGLLSYDSANKLHAELAESWTHDDSGKIWTVKLKPDLVWSDGEKFTANDVVFTVNLMKDENINSTLASSWGSIETKAVDDRTITFSLSNPLMSFDTALTFGVVPKHVLDNKSALDIASIFNDSPQEVAGMGPFLLNSIEEIGDQSIWHFSPNKHYYAGQPKLDELSIRTYLDDTSLLNGLERGEVNAISDITIDMIHQLDQNKFKVIQLKTADGVYAIFNNDSSIVGSSAIRQALRLGLDRTAIRQQVTKDNASPSAPTDLETPIATGVYDSIDQLKQPDYNLEQAKTDLTNAGWVLNDGDQYRTKDGNELAINIVTIAGTNYQNVADQIAQQWRKLGVNATVKAVDASQAQQSYIVPRNYDVLIYQMHLGADPDMYAYWSSSQATATGLNLANYNSRRAEIALSNARTNTNATTREARYVAFVNQWLQDAPAIALYQPSFFYAMDKNIQTLASGGALIDASNRFQNVNEWTVLTKGVMATP